MVNLTAILLVLAAVAVICSAESASLKNGVPPLFNATLQLDESYHQLIVQASSRTSLDQLDDIFVGEYVPVNSYFVYTMSSEAVLSLSVHSDFTVYHYPPDMRISKALYSQRVYEKGPIKATVVLVPSTFINSTHSSIQDIVNEVSDLEDVQDVTITSASSLVITISSSRSLSTLASIPFVHWVELKHRISLLNYEAVTNTVGSAESLTNFYSKNLDGRDQVIAITDSGLDAGSCFFRDPNHGFPYDSVNNDHRKVIHYRVLGDGQDLESGHGTHVAGSVGGKDLNDDSNPNNGVAIESKFVITDIGQGRGLVDPDDLYQNLFSNHYAKSAKIDTNSWGYVTPEYIDASHQADRFAYDNPDYLLIFAAGNDGEYGTNTVISPGNAKNVLTVGATHTTKQGFIDACCVGDSCCDSIDEIRKTKHTPEHLAGYSSIGPTVDLRFKPDILAVGGFTRSAASHSSSSHCSSTAMRGTSMATPLVAGAAALVRQYFVEGHYSRGTVNNPKSSLIKAVLIAGAQSIKYDNEHHKLPQSPSFFQGNGRMNLTRSLSLDDSHFLYVSDDLTFTSSSDTFEFFINVEEVSTDVPFKIVLTWTDPPADVASKFALVNDLDLTVSNPNHDLIYGNHGNSPDILNNVESVQPEQITGIYRLKVSCNRLVTSSQAFSLAVVAHKASVLDRYSSTVVDYLSKCPLDCNSVGTCNTATGSCFCPSSHFGEACEFTICPNNCSERGQCSNGKCDCHTGFMGVDCSIGFCGGVVTLTSRSGVISDHSGGSSLSHYAIDSNCFWIISPTLKANERIVLEFSRVATEFFFDTLTVQENSFAGRELLKVSGHPSNLPDPIISKVPLYISFNSDESVNSYGIEFTWKVIEDGSSIASEFDCFSVGTLSSSGKCSCSQGYYGDFCSDLACEKNTSLPLFIHNFEYFYDGNRTPQKTFFESGSVTDRFKGPISSIKAKSENSDKPFLGTVANSLSGYCIDELAPHKRLLATGSVAKGTIGSSAHSVIFDFDIKVSKFEVDFYYDGTEQSTISLVSSPSSNSALHASGSAKSSCQGGIDSLYGGTLVFESSDTIEEIEVKAEGTNNLLISEVRVQGVCSGVKENVFSFKLLILVVAVLVVVFSQ
ncbi:hypothetical protein P9112_004742 [Eukaryota sp. TZLM1-RC]